MSHFTVLLIGDNIEEQLAPFCESLDYNNEEDRPFLEFKDDSEDLISYNENKPFEYAFEGKTPREVYPTYEAYLKDWAGLSEKDTHTGKYGYWYNPNAKWDWYVIGGRWPDFFKLKSKGSEYTDQAKIKDIDFDGMRKKDGQEAKKRYESVERLFGSIPQLEKRWKDIVDKNGAYSNMSIEDKRTLYHNQPSMKLLKSAQISTDISKEDHDLLIWLNLEDYQVTKEDYIQKAMDGAISTFALIKDGKWFERGQMGWWGCVGNEKEESLWDTEFSNLIKDLPDETLLTVIDCHI